MKLWWVLGVLVLLLLAAAAAAFVLLDEERLRTEFESGLSEELRMEVTIHGAVSLGLSPALNLTGRQVRIEKDGRHVADIDLMRMHIAIPPLFRGEVEPRHFDLADAGINIVRLAPGHFNFEDPDPEPRPDDQEVPSIDLSSAVVHFTDRVTGIEIEAFGCDGRVPKQLAEEDAPGPGLARLEDTVELSCELVRGEDFELANLAVTVHPAEDRIVVDPIRLSMLQGEGRGHMEVELVGETPYWHLQLEVEEFELLAFLRTLDTEVEAEGTMTFEAELWAAGGTREGITQSLEGKAVVHGRTLRFHGEDLDDRLSDLEATQEFGLADLGAFLFAGPAGLLVTKGIDYAVLLGGNGATTEIRQVIAQWRVEDGVAHAEDVAMATARHRVAGRGQIDLGAQRFEGFTFALLDSEGCAVFETSLSGPLDEPEIEEPGVLEAIAGPLLDLIESGIEAITGEGCEVVYAGAVSPR
jgi:hypothetical protein